MIFVMYPFAESSIKQERALVRRLSTVQFAWFHKKETAMFLWVIFFSVFMVMALVCFIGKHGAGCPISNDTK